MTTTSSSTAAGGTSSIIRITSAGGATPPITPPMSATDTDQYVSRDRQLRTDNAAGETANGKISRSGR
jgi:hypothetical protein